MKDEKGLVGGGEGKRSRSSGREF